MITQTDINFLLNNAEIEIYTTEDKINSIGLKKGYSKILKGLGLNRNKQIEILNHLEKLSLINLKKLYMLEKDYRERFNLLKIYVV